MKEKSGIPLEYQMTYQECAEQIGYKMMVYMGVMEQLGLSTFPHFVKTYIDPSTNDSPELRDFERWLKWAMASKNAADREHLYPTDLVQACRSFLKKQAS